MEFKALLKSACVIPVLEISLLERAAPVARALAAEGVHVIELTLRTPCALDAMKAMQDAEPELKIGMGTVRSPADVEACVAAGAAFLVSPGAHPELLKAMHDAALPSLPGVATASEAMMARAAGFSVMKFFPAEPAGGVAYLKALAGPFPDIVFCPTGGVSADRAPDYLALSNVVCVGGSWIATKKMIAEGDWDVVAANARRVIRIREAMRR